MGARLVSIAIALGGCQVVFPLEKDPPVLRPGCSAMSMLATDFADATALDWFPSRFADAQDTIDVVDGGLEFQMPAPGFAQAKVQRFLDLRDSKISIEVDAPFLGANSHIDLDLLALSGDFRLRMHRDGNELAMIREEEGRALEIARFPFDPIGDAVWEISRVDDDVIWSTGPIGGALVERTRFSNLAYATWMTPLVAVQRDPLDTDELTVRFDNVNGGVPVGQACQAFGLTDTFDTGIAPDLWTAADPLVTTEGGQLTMPEPGDFTHDDKMRSAAFHDLTDDEVSVEIVDAVPTDFTISTNLLIQTFEHSTAQLELNVGMLRAFGGVNGDVIGIAPFDPTMHRWWRIRAKDGVVFFETAPDGIDFTVFAQTNTVVGLDRTDVTFGSIGDPDAPKTTRFDNFNNLP